MSNKNIVKPGIGYVDTLITNAILPTLTLWNSINATPNTLTTLGLISSGLCIYFLYKKKVVLSIIFLLLRIYFDYADGLLARKYNQVSTIGDYYDHIVDILFSIGIFLVIALSKYPKKSKKLKYWLICILIIFFILFSMQMGCIEHEYNDNKDTSISNLRHICPVNLIDILKAFDNGTFYIIIIIVFIVFCKNTKLK